MVCTVCKPLFKRTSFLDTNLEKICNCYNSLASYAVLIVVQNIIGEIGRGSLVLAT